ncbi:hypothetical protein D9M70_569320 [compost metagenome]
MDEHVDVQAEHFRDQQRHLLADQPQFLHGLHPVEAGRWRQVHRAGQFGVGDAGILLKAVEDADIGAVELAHERFYLPSQGAAEQST